MYNTENIPKQNSSIPPLSEVPTYKSGPTIEMLRTRAIVIYLFMCIVGILPSILTKIDRRYVAIGSGSTCAMHSDGILTQLGI